ncbi:MAG: APC family permease [Clostridia bacterium]
MFNNVKSVIIGKPLKNEALAGEKLGVLWGLPILSSDAISSVAYAGQAILAVLVPVIGVLAFTNMVYIAGAIICLLILLMLSYRQTIESYPNGGGAYIVAKDNIGIMAGVVAGAALSVDYVLTVAVSVSSGVEQITSGFAGLKPYTIPICVGVVLIITLGNLRGVRESSKLFGIPSYAFIIAILSMLVFGFAKLGSGYVPPTPTLKALADPVIIILMLRAFANGCTALTGIEAVSNSIPNFKDPATKHAKTVLLYLAIIVLVLFGGTTILSSQFHIIYNPGSALYNKAIIVQLAYQVFGNNFMYYYVIFTTFIILILAANTAYSGFPLLVSIMAKEGYAPKQFTMRGDRLSYSTGIIALSVIATLLIVIFKADVTLLLGLYAIGVFISFTLSQSGMFLKWFRGREKNWIPKAALNGFGAFVTFIVVIIIAVFKFTEGAWIVVLVIPGLVYLMLKVKKHYTSVSEQLRLTPDELRAIDLSPANYVNRVIVPVESINKASVRALRYAKTISDNIVAFNVSIDEESGRKIKEKYSLLNTDIPLIIKYSPYRRVLEPLLKFIESTEYTYKKGDMITVILPQFAVKTWWNKILHNHTRLFIERELIKHKHIVVATMPLQLKKDDLKPIKRVDI